MSREVDDLALWLEDALREVLESMCFLSLEGSTPCQVAASDWLSCALQFAGVPSGAFGLRAPLSMARIMAANFLGREEAELNDGQIMDVLCEVANIACGSVLARLDPQRSFALTPPVPGQFTTREVWGIEGVCRTFTLDEGSIETRLEIGTRE